MISKGRAIVNLLSLSEGEQIAECLAIRDFNKEDHFLMMATRKGLIKKTPLEAYSRPKKGGIIAIKLKEDVELVDVVITKPGDEVLLATSTGMAISIALSSAACLGVLPMSKWRKVFSMSTIGSSTRRPITSARPPSVMALSVLPVKYKPTTAASTDSGIVSAIMTVERTLPMKISTISEAKTAPSTPSHVRLLMALRTKID